MAEIAKILGVDIANISKIQGIDKGEISSFMGEDIPAGGGIALVQQKAATVADATAGCTATFDTPLTAGNSVIACISFNSTGGPAFSIDPVLVGGGAQGLSIPGSATADLAGVRAVLYVVHNIVGGETAMTFSLDLALRASVNVSEWNGLPNVAEEVSTTLTGTSTAPSSDVLTPISADNLIIVMGGWAANDYSAGPSGGFTRMTQTGGGTVFQESAYKIQTSADAGTAGWTLANSINWAAVGAAFGGT